MENTRKFTECQKKHSFCKHTHDEVIPRETKREREREKIFKTNRRTRKWQRFREREERGKQRRKEEEERKSYIKNE